jgi:dihydroxyacetone kinase-like predicted kinase
MNPSTADLLRAVQSLAADEAVVLPNNSNIVLAAEHAGANADRTVEVVGTTSIQAGLAALLAFDGSRGAAENAAEMRDAIAAVATGEVTIASRDVELDGVEIRKGRWLGLADDRPVAATEGFEDAAFAVAEALLDGSRSLLTLLVVGDESAVKVHVHTDDPGAALSLGTRAGTIDGIEIANMHEQTQQREERLLAAVPDPPSARCGVVAVVAGEGNRRLFESLAEPVGPIRLVEGGQTMNPSTADLLRAVQSLVADEAVVLPNNSNILLAAEHAGAHADRAVEVVATTSIQAGLAALLAFDGSRGAAANAAEMRDAIAAVAAGEVTIASRDVELDGVEIRKGHWLGLADDRPVAATEGFEDAAFAVAEALLDGSRSLLTLLVGEEAPSLERLLERVAAAHPEVEIDVQQGGQPHYALLLSAE